MLPAETEIESRVFYVNITCPLRLSLVILFAVDTLSNTANSEKNFNIAIN